MKKINTKKYSTAVMILALIIMLFSATAVYKIFLSSNLPKSKDSYNISKSDYEHKEYKSKALKFGINVPFEMAVEENGNRVTISRQDKSIYIERSATNDSNLRDYLKNLDIRNKNKILSEAEYPGLYLAGVSREIQYKSGETQKYVVFFIDGRVYDIFTDEPTLYSTLDLIAQSFQYLP